MNCYYLYKGVWYSEQSILNLLKNGELKDVYSRGVANIPSLTKAVSSERVEKVEQIKEKQDGINGDERTEEVQERTELLGEKPEDQVTETGEKTAEAGAAEEVGESGYIADTAKILGNIASFTKSTEISDAGFKSLVDGYVSRGMSIDDAFKKASDIASKKRNTDAVSEIVDNNISTVSVGDTKLRRVFIRFGEPRKSDSGGYMPSSAYAGSKEGQKQEGISVFEAGYDPITGKYVIITNEASGLSLMGLIGQKRDIYLVEGDELVARGEDFEPQINPETYRSIKKLSIEDVVDDNETEDVDLRKITPSVVASEAYHEAKKSGNNPTLVKAIENLLKQPTAAIEPLSQPEGQIVQPEGKVGEKGEETMVIRDVNDVEIKVGDTVKTAQQQGGLLPPAAPKVGIVIKETDMPDGYIDKAVDGDELFIKFREKGKDFDQYIRLQGKINEVVSPAAKTETVKPAPQVEKEPTTVTEITKEEQKVVAAETKKSTAKETKKDARQKRFEEIDIELGSELENLADALGIINKLTGEQRAKLLPTVVKVSKLLAEKYALKGQELIDEVVEYFRGKNIELDDEILKEVKDAETQQGRPLQDSGDETGEGRGQRDSDMPEVNRPIVQDGEKAEEKVSPKYAGRVNSRAGIRYAYGEGFSESAKQAYRDNKLYEYTPEHHGEVAELAQSIFDLNGANETEKIYYNKNIPRRVRVGIGLLLVKHYSGLANEAAKNGNMDEADKWDDKTNAMYKSIQDDIATEAGRDVSFFGSEFVKALLTPYGTARSIQRGMEKQRSDIENSKMYKNDVESIVEEVGKLRENVIVEIQKSKKYEEIKRRYTEPKNAKVAAIKEKRSKLIDKLKKTTQLSSSVVGLSSEQIEILGEIAYTYIEEGVVRVTDLVKKIKKAAKAAGVTLSDEQAKSVLPDEIKGTKITDLEKQEAIEDAAAQLAMREFGMVIDRKSAKDNPLLAMVNTLTAKFSERAEKGKKPTPKSTMDKVVAAIVNKSEYMDVWKEAKDIALQQVDDMKVDDETKKEYKRRINDAYKNATEFSVSEKQVQELIRKSLSEREMSIDDVIRGHYSKREIYLEDLKRDLIRKSGLTAENAAELADAVDNAFNTIMTEKGTKLIDRYVRYKTKPKTTVERKTEAALIIELINIGAFDSQKFRDVFAEVYGIPKLEKEDKDYIVRKGKLLQMTKGDDARASIEQAMMSHILNLKGFDAAEYATALWYAHILSGITTQMRNVMDAMTSTLIETMHLAGGNRSDIKRVIDAHLKNFSGEGWYRLQEAMLTGVSPVVGKKYVDMPSALERWKFVPDIKPEDTNADIAIKKSMTKLANMYTGLAKYIPRTMVAPDALFFTSAKEAVAQTLVSQSERKQLEKLKGRKLNKEELKQLENTIATKLAMTPAQTAQIRKQVEEESKEFAKNQQDLGEKPRTRTVVKNGKKKTIEYYGYSPSEAKIREYELRDQMRGVDIMEKAITIAGRMTGNTDMYGTMGYLIDFISRGLKGFTMIINKPVVQKVKGKYQFSWNPTDKIRTHPLKFIMPFTNIVSNVITRNMGWTVPIGIMRAATGKFGRFAPEESRYRVEMSPEERARLWQKVIKIVIIQAGLYGLMAAINGDDDEPYVEISLDGTGDYDKNKQLESKGWRPYSIRVGNQSFDYRQLGGLAAVFMVIGYMNDRKRYTDNDDSELELYAKAMGVSLGYLLKATPLYGVNKAMDWMTYAFRGDERNAMKSLAKLAGGIGTGFVSPKTLSEMEDVMKFMGILDREKTNPESFMAKLIQYVPFVGDPLARGRVAIDKFGEPIDATLSTAAIIRRVEQDPLKMYYINQGYFAPEFNMSRQEFELWDGAKRVKRVLNPNNKYEVALANSYEIILGQKFKQAVENAMQRGLEGEKFVEEMESKYRDFQKESKKQIFSLTVQDPVEATDDAIEID